MVPAEDQSNISIPVQTAYYFSMSFLTSKHAKYFKLCLHSLPWPFQSEDANRISIVYFVITGLDLLSSLDLEHRKEYIESIYSNMILSQDATIQSFRASETFRLDPSANSYDLPSLLATLFALSSLLTLKEDYSQRIDRHKIMAFVSRCQIKEGPEKGSFRPVLGANGEEWGESDLRVCYIVASIRKMVGYDRIEPSARLNDIDVDALTHFVRSKFNFDGGMALMTLAESNVGLTFCGLATLKLLGEELTKADNWALTENWLVHRQIGRREDIEPFPNNGSTDDTERDDDSHDSQTSNECDFNQIGGFNGRDNKQADTCYAWWLLALLALAGRVGLVDTQRAVEYLLGCQNKLVGGIGKTADARPDPYHLFLSIAAISLLKAAGAKVEGSELLQEVDAELVISRELREFMEKMWLR